MCLFKKREEIVPKFDHKFSKGDFVDFWHRDDVYFGTVSSVKLVGNKAVYEIDIAGQCPTTFEGIEEEKVIRIHKEW